jgi:hypothetical protein
MIRSEFNEIKIFVTFLLDISLSNYKWYRKLSGENWYHIWENPSSQGGYTFWIKESVFNTNTPKVVLEVDNFRDHIKYRCVKYYGKQTEEDIRYLQELE